MKGTEKITEQIAAEAAKKADAIIEEAKERCAQIRLDYEKQARELYTEKIRAGVSTGQQRLEAMQTGTLREKQDALIKEKQALVDGCFALAAQRLTEPGQRARLEELKGEMSDRIAAILFD